MTQSRDAGARQPQPAARRSPLPIAVYLFVLALVALVPAFAFSAVLLQRNNEAQEQVVQALMQSTTRALLQSIDRDVEGTISTLRALASSPAVTAQDIDEIYARAEGVLAGTGSVLVIIDEGLRQVVNTRFPQGTPLPEVRDVDNIQRAIASGQPMIGNVTYSPTAERLVVPVLTPHQADDGSTLVVVLNKDAADFRPVLLSQQLPEGWHIALADAGNNVIAASDDSQVVAGGPFFIPPEPGDTTWSYRTVGDRSLATIALVSSLSGWRVAAWAPREVVDQPMRNAVWSLVYGGILLAALVAASIYWVTNQIAGSVQGLADDAKLLGSGTSVPVRDYPIAEIAAVSGALHDAGERRLAAESEVRFLLRELAHRSKNQMTVISAMAKQTAKHAESLNGFVSDFEKRIFGLARSTDLLLATGAAGVDVTDLFGHQIDPFCPISSGRVTLTGPSLRLNLQSAQILGMAAHELATNAVKYGAFSRDDGTLEVSWQRTPTHVSFVWRETVPGGLQERPERRGFGTVVLENMVGSALGANVTRTLHSDGIEWRFEVPNDSLDPRRASDEVESTSA